MLATMRYTALLSNLPLKSVLICLFLFLAAPAMSENFPRPAELERDVNFWLRVYTQVDTRSGYIHDAYNLSVVYETVQLSGQRRADDKAIKASKGRYAAILEHLATQRSGLSEEQQRVLSLWGDSVTATELRRAANNLRFQLGQSDRFQAGLTRSGQWNDHIHAVLAEKGLPAGLAALPHVESSFNPEAYSSVGAAGIWQFTRSTGRRYLHIDYVIDERMDPFAATEAAAQLLEHNHQLTGTWPLALTAYNHGASGIRRASKQMGTKDIATIVRGYKGRSFGFASRNFYVSFLAALEVSENPDRYFKQRKTTGPVDYVEVTLSEYLPVDAFARAFNTDFTELKTHNRALLEPVWRGKKYIPEGYTLRVPSSNVSGSASELLASIPANQRHAEQTPDLFHKVVPGDTVSEIASRYGHSVRDVASMNGLNKRYQIRIGQVLRLPLEGTVASADVNTSAPLEIQQTSLPEEPVAIASLKPAQQQAPIIEIRSDMLADPSDYTVDADNTIEIQATETLGHYAEWLDLRASQLRQLNGMPYGRALVIGKRLKLDFSRVESEEFERRRLAFQHDLQQSFFMAWQIRKTHRHVIAPGESLWVLTQRQYKIPMWLLRQYNPDLDLDRLQPGTVIVIPELAEA